MNKSLTVTNNSFNWSFLQTVSTRCFPKSGKLTRRTKISPAKKNKKNNNHCMTKSKDKTNHCFRHNRTILYLWINKHCHLLPASINWIKTHTKKKISWNTFFCLLCRCIDWHFISLSQPNRSLNWLWETLNLREHKSFQCIFSCINKHLASWLKDQSYRRCSCLNLKVCLCWRRGDEVSKTVLPAA